MDDPKVGWVRVSFRQPMPGGFVHAQTFDVNLAALHDEDVRRAVADQVWNCLDAIHKALAVTHREVGHA